MSAHLGRRPVAELTHGSSSCLPRLREIRETSWRRTHLDRRRQRWPKGGRAQLARSDRHVHPVPAGALRPPPSSRPMSGRKGESFRGPFCDSKLEFQIGISSRSAELEAFGDRYFLMVRGLGHGAGLGGAHEHRILHGRYRRACCWGFLGRLCLCLSRGSSGRGGREATKTPGGGDGRTTETAGPD
jgi:hypothetical protein